MTNDQDLGRRLRRGQQLRGWREAMSLTVGDAAAMARTEPRDVEALERGEDAEYMDFDEGFRALAQVYGIPDSELVR